MKKFFDSFVLVLAMLSIISGCASTYSSKDIENNILKDVRHPIEINVNHDPACVGIAYFTNPTVTFDRVEKRVLINYDLTVAGVNLCPGDCKTCRFSTKLIEKNGKFQFTDLEIDKINCQWFVPQWLEKFLLNDAIKGYLYKIVIALNKQIKDAKSFEFYDDNRLKVFK